MRPESKTLLTSLFREKTERNIWEWARDEVDYSRAPKYDTPLHSTYDPDFIPIFKEIMEDITDPTISEIYVLKPARAGASENLHFIPMRYFIAEDPGPMLYITGDESGMQRMLEERIKWGMDLTPGLQKKYKKARNVENRIYFEDCMRAANYPRNRMAFKQSGYKVIFGDEFSTWPDYSADMMRKRTDTYDFSTIIAISSPDPAAKRKADDDPIFIEYEDSDRRYFFMPDPGAPPGSDEVFRFMLGGPDKDFGLKWDPTARDDNGNWDYDRVKESAYYLTPCGARLEESDRMDMIRKAKSRPTNDAGRPGVRGYHINSFYLPFKKSSFGEIAVEFLKAKKRGPKALRIFMFEWMAEKWYDEKEKTTDDQMYERQKAYEKGHSYPKAPKYEDIYIGKQITRFLTADVQKGHLWAVCRDWVEGGDSGLVDWRYIPDFPQLNDMAEELGVYKEYIDVNYRLRQMEVYDYCYQYPGAYPTVGSEKLALPWKMRMIDPFEGKVGGGVNSLEEFIFSTDIMKTMTLDMINGESQKTWAVYHGIEQQYVSMTVSEEKVNGVWTIIQGRQNHLWDCEVLQMLAAIIEGIYISPWVVPHDS